jgi:uncharacterized membrane protein YoaT (DUF817 family)
MHSTESNGLLRASIIVSVILLVWGLVDVSESSHPVLMTLIVVFYAMFLPAFVLHFRMREKWLLPGVVSAIGGLHLLQEVLKPGGGSRWMLWIMTPICIIFSILAVEEGIRAWKRHRAGGLPSPTLDPPI